MWHQRVLSVSLDRLESFFILKNRILELSNNPTSHYQTSFNKNEGFYSYLVNSNNQSYILDLDLQNEDLLVRVFATDAMIVDEQHDRIKGIVRGYFLDQERKMLLESRCGVNM